LNWISINDRLPEEGQAVIYWFQETGVARGKFTQHYAFLDRKMNTFHGASGFLSDDVTHWQSDEGQPLPEPPEEKTE
jgi:hypothetical protein